MDDATVTQNSGQGGPEIIDTAGEGDDPVEFLTRRRVEKIQKATIGDGMFVYEVKRYPFVEAISRNRFVLANEVHGLLEPGDHIIGKPLDAQTVLSKGNLSPIHLWNAGENFVEIIEWIPQNITPDKISNMKKLEDKYVPILSGGGVNLELADADSININNVRKNNVRALMLMRDSAVEPQMRTPLVPQRGGALCERQSDTTQRQGGGRKSNRRKTSKRRKSTRRKSTKRRKSKTRRRRR